MALSSNDQWDEIDECSLHKSESNLNQKTQRFMAHFSKISVPQFFKKSLSRKNKNASPQSKRPVSMYNTSHEDDLTDLSQYNASLVMALREAESRVLESEKHRSNLESKVQSLEKELEYLQNESKQQVAKERALMLQVQEFERRKQTKDAEFQEMSLNARIREMELSSEIATLSQRLSMIETEKQEQQIHKIMKSQNRIMEQTLPYTLSSENIFDSEDGLFNNQLFEEILKEQSQILAMDPPESPRSWKKSDEDFVFQDPDHCFGGD